MESKKAGITLGIISLITWLVPLIGYPVSIIGLLVSIWEINQTETKLAYRGLTFNVIGLILTIISSVIGLYMNSMISQNGTLSNII